MFAASTFQATSGYKQKASTRLGAVILTNCIATSTIVILSILSLSHVYVLPSLEAVVIFVLIPLNASLNPIINTITTSEFWPIRQFISTHVKEAFNFVAEQLSKLHRTLKLKYEARPDFFRLT